MYSDQSRDQRLIAPAQLLDRVDELVYHLSPDGKALQWNDRVPAVTGYSHEALAKSTVTDHFAPDEHSVIAAAIDSVVDDGQAVAVEADLLTRTGDRIPYEFSGTPVPDDAGDVAGIVGIGRDISERKARERELVRQNKDLEAFASLVSHDLRNPLTVAQLRTELLQKEDENSHLLAIAEALARMEVIIEQTLALARQGDTTGEIESVTLTEIVDRSWTMVETREATVEIVDDVALKCDPDRLQHLFENLFRNAVEHAGEAVTIRVGGQNGGIYVEDDGPGIDETRREAILEPGHSSASGGAGFGLTIVKRVVEAHGWEIRVLTGSDGGTRFEIEGTATTGDQMNQ